METIILLAGIVLFYFVASKAKFRTVHHYHEDMDEAVLTVKEWYPFGLRTRICRYRKIGELWFRGKDWNGPTAQVSGGVARALTKLERTARCGE